MLTATLSVLPDGSVGDVSMVATSGPVTNKEMTAALKKWKFKPALCGSEPVAFDADFVIKWTH